MSITYQQAKRIRKTRLSDLISDQIMYEKSVGKGIKKGISLKVRGKIKGITEKFDPLNIAKFLTFGSSLGPALLGHLLGRDVRDIQYFSGRFKPIRENRIRSEKIKPLPRQDVVGDLNEILSKMYKLTATTHENELRRKQLSDNKMEEMEFERERRHQEILDALELLTGKKIKRTTSRIVPTSSGVGAGIVAAGAAGIAAASVASVAARAVPALTRMFLMTPLGLAVTASAALLYLLDKDENPEETTKQILGAVDPGSVSKAIMESAEETTPIEKKKLRILADRPRNKKSYLFWRDKPLQDEYLKEIGWDEKTGTTEEERKRGIDYIDREGRNVGKPISGLTNDEAQSARTEFAKDDPRLKIVSGEMDTKGQMLNRATTENIENKLEPKTTAPEPVVNNTNINSSSNSTTIKKNLPNVRNSESTFQRMIFESTRVV